MTRTISNAYRKAAVKTRNIAVTQGSTRGGILTNKKHSDSDNQVRVLAGDVLPGRGKLTSALLNQS